MQSVGKQTIDVQIETIDVKIETNDVESLKIESPPTLLRIKPEDQPFCCDKCGKSFSKGRNQKYHQKRHLKWQYAFPCGTCFRVYRKKSDLINHTLVHKGGKPFECDECDRSFAQRDKLQRHKKTHLAGEKKFICVECSMSFREAYGLKTHARIHTGEKPFQCEE